jgi:hypothetical protein
MHCSYERQLSIKNDNAYLIHCKVIERKQPLIHRIKLEKRVTYVKFE